MLDTNLIFLLRTDSEISQIYSYSLYSDTDRYRLSNNGSPLPIEHRNDEWSLEYLRSQLQSVQSMNDLIIHTHEKFMSHASYPKFSRKYAKTKRKKGIDWEKIVETITTTQTQVIYTEEKGQYKGTLYLFIDIDLHRRVVWNTI